MARTGGEILVEALVDPHEPPMPPKVTLEQSYKLGKSLVRGTPAGGKILATVLENKAREMI